MNRYRGLVAVVGVISVIGGAAKAHAQQPAPTLSVVGFTLSSGAKLSNKETDALAEAVAVRLVESGRYRVLDRQWLGINDGGKPLPLAQVREAATRANVDYLVVGRIEKVRSVYQYGGPVVQQRAPSSMPSPIRYPMPLSRGRTRIRSTDSLRVTIDLIDPASGNSITTTTSTCAAPRPRATMLTKLLAPVSPMAAVAVIADARRPLIDPGLSHAIGMVTQTLVAWHPPIAVIK